MFSNHNVDRFFVHLGFALGATALMAVPQMLDLVHLSPTLEGAILVFSTSAASFFRGKATE